MPHVNPLSRPAAIALYQTMLRIRLAERRVSEIYPSDKIQSPIHLSTGQEAVSAGLCLALRRGDHLYGTYRGHGIYIAKGGNLGRMFAELYAKDTGCSGGKGGSMHLVAPEVGLMGCSAIVASTIPLAVGDAMAAKFRKMKRVSAAIFGDGAIDEGVFFESVNFAVLRNLPVLFLLENNGYAVHSRVKDRHKQLELCRITEGLGLPGKRFDGNDVFKVYEEVSRAADSIRRGRGPVLLEFVTDRWNEHVGANSDWNAPYRPPEERRLAERRDPLAQARVVLRRDYRVADADFLRWEKAVLKDVDRAVDFAERSPFPPVERLYEGVFK